MRQVKQELSPRERRVFVELPAIRAVLTLALPTILGQLITVIYNFADTYIAAKDFADFGDPDDPYKVNIDKVITTETPSSPLFIFLWVLLNVILIAGVALCVLFVILPAVRRKKDKQPE